MTTPLSHLEAILREEVALYRALVSRLPFKIALIRKNRIDQLGQLTRQEEQDLARVAELETVRESAVEALLVGLPAGIPARLVAIVPYLEPQWQERFNTLGATLKELAFKLQEGHATCTLMLRAGLETLDATVTFIGEAVANRGPNVYGRGSRAPVIGLEAPSLLLDRRA